MKIVDKVLVLSSIAVALSTAVFPYVIGTGPGTILLQFVVVGAALWLGEFAKRLHSPLWLMMMLLNIGIFFLAAIPIYAFSRKRAPRLGSLLIICWSILYVAMLFLLFPAANIGP